jgi:alkylated DNA nucleotide flippase Atl1
MAACPGGQGIPWHRVVGAGGRLLLREPNVSLQRTMLETEGLRIVEKRVQDFAKQDWRPQKAKSRR